LLLIARSFAYQSSQQPQRAISAGRARVSGLRKIL